MHLYSVLCTFSLRQDKARTELEKRNRKKQEKENANKERKKCQSLLKETRVEHNKLTGNFKNREKKLKEMQTKKPNPIFSVSTFQF